MRKEIYTLANLETTPYKIISISKISRHPFKIEVSEKIGMDNFKLIEEKSFEDYYVSIDFIENKIEGYGRIGFAEISPIHISGDIKSETLEIINNDSFNKILKISDDKEKCNFTTLFIESFNGTGFISLFSYDKNNLSQEVQNNFNYLKKNEFEISEIIKQGFWEEITDYIDEFYDIYLDAHKEDKLDGDYNDYLESLKPNNSITYSEGRFYIEKRKSNKFFYLASKIRDAETWEEKSKIFNEICILKSIDVEGIPAPKYNHEYGHIAFFFDYYFDDGHGLILVLDNRTEFNRYY